MPDHYHFLLKIIKDNSFSKFIGDVENSFTRYFNIKFDWKGPLWQNSFKAVEIRSNEQLLHVSRYIHLNPTTSRLVDSPEDWIFSSYKDFITDKKLLNNPLAHSSRPMYNLGGYAKVGKKRRNGKILYIEENILL